MVQDFPIPRQDSPASRSDTAEWGLDQTAARERLFHGLARFGRDRRLAPVIGVLGAVPAVASLLGEWTVVTIPMAELEGDAPLRVPAGVSEVGNFGVAYLIGLFGMVACLALASAGTRTVRHNARTVGLMVSGVLLAMLVAAATVLPEASGRLYYLRPNGELQTEYGRGLVTAFVATVVLGLALLVAKRSATAPTPRWNGPVAPKHSWSGKRAEGTAGGFWRWSRPGYTTDDGDRAARDLTVSAVPPFVRPEQPTD